jgi:hypothetical protein
MWAALREDKHAVPAVLTAGFGGWMCWQALGMPRPDGWASAPGLFPLMIGGGLVIMAVGLWFEGSTARRRRAGNTALAAARDAEADPQPLSRAASLRTLAITAAIAAYIVSLSFFPFEIATVGFAMLAARIFGERSLMRGLLVGLAVALAISLTFILGLETLLPGTQSIVERLLL